MTITLISTVTVGVTSSAITFSSIPQTPYTDLLVLVSSRSLAVANLDNFYLRFNSVSTSVYSTRAAFGNGSSAQSNVTSANLIDCGIIPGTTATLNTFGNIAIYLGNYTSAITKTVSIDLVGEQNGTTSYQYIVGGLFNSTAAISEINLFSANGSFVQHTTASLYGITKGSGGATVTS